jgi:hypothetical protein
MKEVPKKDTPEVSGGVQSPDRSSSSLVLPSPAYPPGPCVPIYPDPTTITQEK